MPKGLRRKRVSAHKHETSSAYLGGKIFYTLNLLFDTIAIEVTTTTSSSSSLSLRGRSNNNKNISGRRGVAKHPPLSGVVYM